MARQFCQQGGDGEMQFGDLHFDRAIFRANVADTLDAAQRGEVERVGIGVDGKRDHVFGAGGGDQFAGTAEGDLFAVVQDGDAFAEALGFVHVVRCEKNGAAGGFELLDQIPKLTAGLRVEAGGGLIEKKKIGITDERAGERQTLFLAAGKIANAGILFFLELYEGNGFCRAWSLFKKTAEQAKRFEDGQFFGKLRILQLNAEPLAELLCIGAPAHAEQFHFAGIRFCETFTDFDCGCFTRAVGAEEAEAFAHAHFEVEAIDGDHILIGLAKTCDAQNRAD